MSIAALVAAFAAPNAGTVLTIGTTVLVALLAAGSAAGGFAAFKTGRTNAIAASAVARAAEAEATANTWRGRAEAIEAEFAAFREQAERDRARGAEAQAVSDHEIAKLQQQVAALEGVVTARHEITQLTAVVTGLGETVGAMLVELRADHERQHRDHRQILAGIGGRRGSDADIDP